MKQQHFYSSIALWGLMLLRVQLYAAQPAKDMNPVAPINQTYESADVDRQDSMVEKPSWRERLMTRFIQKRIKKQATKWKKKHAQGDRQQSYKSLRADGGSLGKMRPHWLAVVAMLLGLGAIAVLYLNGFLTLFLVLELVAMILGIISLTIINRNPEKFRGKGMALVGILSGPTFLLFVLTLFALTF